jgi:hypothetical protein
MEYYHLIVISDLLKQTLMLLFAIDVLNRQAYECAGESRASDCNF